MQIWARLAEIFKPWYDEIQDVCNRSRILHGDETGWRADGKLEWLRRLTTRNETYYFIVDSRGSDVIKRFFNNDWTGVLVSDFWNVYNHVEGGKAQRRLVHLLRELKRVETNDDQATFKQTLETLLQDAFQLKRDKAIDPSETYVSSRNELERRLDRLLDFQSENVEVKRSVKRLRKYRASILTFLYHDEVPFDNNHAERNIRPAVLTSEK